MRDHDVCFYWQIRKQSMISPQYPLLPGALVYGYIPVFCYFYIGNKLLGPSMFALRAKIYGVTYNQSSSIAFDETSSAKKLPISRLFIGHHTVVYWSAFRNHEGSTFAEKDRNRLHYRIGPKRTQSLN